uniref:Uncharacterized protein n=2 Tax=Brassica campestris TaxID=3711 RepID=M4FJ09_BRACM
MMSRIEEEMVEMLQIAPFTKESLAEAKIKLEALDEKDRERRRTPELKNNLEYYVYATKEKERLDSLKAIGSPISLRSEELTARPVAVDYTQKYPTEVKEIIKEWETNKTWLPKVKLDEVVYLILNSFNEFFSLGFPWSSSAKPISYRPSDQPPRGQVMTKYDPVEISPRDIEWIAEDHGAGNPYGYSGQANVLSRTTGPNNVLQKGSSLAKTSIKNELRPSQNGTGKRNHVDIRISRPTSVLIREVERVRGSHNPDPQEVEMAKRVLEEQEHALVGAITKLGDISKWRKWHVFSLQRSFD